MSAPTYLWGSGNPALADGPSGADKTSAFQAAGWNRPLPRVRIDLAGEPLLSWIEMSIAR